MGVPNSEVGYASAMPRREDHDVDKDMWGHRGEKICVMEWVVNKIKKDINQVSIFGVGGESFGLAGTLCRLISHTAERKRKRIKGSSGIPLFFL